MAEPSTDQQRPRPTSSGRRSFAVVVLLGLASAGLAAVAGHKEMLAVPGDVVDRLEQTFPAAGVAGADAVEFPLAGALALVVLACWGVVLVARGLFRRIVAGLAVLGSVGILVVLLLGGFVQDDDAGSDLADRIGYPGTDPIPLHLTAWFWAALVGAVVATLASLAAVRLAPGWPEMGSRYDAPGGAAPAGTDDAAPPEEQSNLELWKALDEGQDPTA